MKKKRYYENGKYLIKDRYMLKGNHIHFMVNFLNLVSLNRLIFLRMYVVGVVSRNLTVTKR